MSSTSAYQIVISGVGGQGILFITRLLAEAAIGKGLPVFTSETHGMAQRGGTVISHLKVGNFASPLITPGRADGLIALKAENLSQHSGYLRPGGWAAVNRAQPMENPQEVTLFCKDADRLAQQLNDSRSVNLIMLGLAFGVSQRYDATQGALHCNLDDIVSVLTHRLEGNPSRLKAAISALRAGAQIQHAQ